MAEKHTVAMFIQGDDGNRIQVGWASPKDADGVRTFEYSPGFEGTRARDVSFEDDELSQQIAEEQHEARLANNGAEGEEFKVQVQEELPEGFVPLPPVPVTPIDTPVDEPVEIDNGGQITEIAEDEEDEEAEFQRLLAEEEAAKNNEAPKTRRDFRDQEED